LRFDPGLLPKANSTAHLRSRWSARC
jgi:hypothetical protein